MSGPKPKNQRSQNAFDLSKNIGFTAKLGEILPIYYFDVSPNDKVKINFNAFTRTVPLNQSGFLSVREHYNAYFVPYRLLYKAMPAFLTQMFDETNMANSMVAQSDIPQGLPMLDIMALIRLINKTPVNQYDDAGMVRPYQVLKLLHYLKYQVDALSDYSATACKANILPLLAYHKIYNDYFRLQQWELPNAATFNCDYFAASSSPLLDHTQFFKKEGSVTKFVSQKTMLDMEYCSYPADMFTGVVPQQQYGTVSTIQLNTSPGRIDNYLKLANDGAGFEIPNSTQTSNNYALVSGDFSTPWRKISSANTPTESIQRIALDNSEGSFMGTLRSALDGLSASINALELRQVKAEQRWKEITQLHKKDYKSQIDAHFGKSISSNLSTVCHYIGGMQQDLNLNTVINNNLVEGNADNKAFGTASGRSSCRFTAQEHGIIMIVYNATILPQYETFGLSPVNVKNVPTDFLLPEYDKIGYEEVDNRFLFVNRNFESIKLGYAPRYYDYKTTYDEYMGGFNRYASDFVANQGKLSVANFGYSSKAAFPGYTASLDFAKYYKPGTIVTPLGTPLAFNYKAFKVRPDLLNDICITQVTTASNQDDAAWSKPELTSNTLAGDQFLCRCQIGVTQIETCSRYGLPL